MRTFCVYDEGLKSGSVLKHSIASSRRLSSSNSLLCSTMQINLSSLSQEIQSFTLLNPDSSECYKDIALFVCSCFKLKSTTNT